MAVRPDRFYTLSLFSGVFGLDLGYHITRPESRCAVAVEGEGFAAACIVSRMEEGWFPPFAIWDDITSFDGKPWRGVVQAVVGGPPCQSSSQAGSRKGTADERWLWGEALRIVEEVEPEEVFFENVPGLLAGKLQVEFGRICNRLQGLGYRVAAGLFTASEVSASHRRERVFILGSRRPSGSLVPYGRDFVPDSCLVNPQGQPERESGDEVLSDPRQIARGESGWTGVRIPGDRDEVSGRVKGESLADSERLRYEGSQPTRGKKAGVRRRPAVEGKPLANTPCQLHPGGGDIGPGRRGEPADGRGEVADSQRERLQGQFPGRSAEGSAFGAGGMSFPFGLLGPPGPGTWQGFDCVDGGGIRLPLDRDAAMWVEILAARPELAPAITYGNEVTGEVQETAQPAHDRVADALAAEVGCSSIRIDRLRACGNGVVGLQAAFAHGVLRHALLGEWPEWTNPWFGQKGPPGFWFARMRDEYLRLMWTYRDWLKMTFERSEKVVSEQSERTCVD